MTIPVNLSRDPEILCTEINGESVLLDPRNQRMFSLNRTGTIVWETVEHGMEAIVAGVLSVYDVDESTVRDDVTELLKALEHAGLVVARV